MRAAIPLGSCLILSAAVCAQTPSDWRMIGGADNDYVFYDASGVRKTPDGHFYVWLKALPMKATDKEANREPDSARTERVAKKIATGYVPPIGWFEVKLTQDQIIESVVREDVANGASIEPTMRMLIELDCPNRISRNLSVYVHKAGKVGHSDKTSEWQHIAPETNIARLHAAVCQ